ncbi:FAD/NAD-P-binding domain-containing protein [Mycena floridula]|nr:FAD/NAD-P-binding domain-containing protein [Mycena floridula]
MTPIQSSPTSQITVDATHVASTWLSQLSAALTSGSIDAFADCILPDGFFRDVLIFSWDIRCPDGTADIHAYLADKLKAGEITDLKLDEKSGLTPEYGFIGPPPLYQGVSGGFTFNTPIAIGQGFYRLMPDETGVWKALSLSMAMDELKGHEEAGAELGFYGGHTLLWEDVKRERREQVEADPQVLIIGAGQNGLMTAARFKQMGIRAIIVEQNARVGDNWRQRYPILTLHTPRNQYQNMIPIPMLYQPFPKNWPIHTPKEKLADWFELYASSQDLVIWTKSRPLPTPKYDSETKKWTVVIDRNGQHATLHPSHVVIAAGVIGAPRIPANLADTESFTGERFHASKYPGGRHFTGKRVVVVGAGNTAADICQDLAFHKAASVTMVQRSKTAIMGIKTATKMFARMFPDDVPIEVSDLKNSSLPFGLARIFMRETQGETLEADKGLHEKLEKAGFKVDKTSSIVALTYERFGALDVGCADRIAAGDVKIKNGVEPTGFNSDSLLFSDNSSLKADVVIWATGYHLITESLRPLFGDDVIDQGGPVWGLDKENNVKGCYRPTGHPGFWYAGGGFNAGRDSSKTLALSIKAQELGYWIV